MDKSEIKLGWIAAPDGAVCDFMDVCGDADVPCGEPAIRGQTLEMEGTPHEETVYYCEEHRIHVMRNVARQDQASAFTRQHGYPPDQSILELVHALGRRHMRATRGKEEKAPPQILEMINGLVDSAERHVSAWLGNREPMRETHKATLLKMWDMWAEIPGNENLCERALDEMEVGFSRAVQLAGEVDDKAAGG